MKRMMKRVSMILVLAMVFSLIPQGAPPAFAAGDAATIDVSDTVNKPTSVSFAGNKFTIGTLANNTTITVTSTTAINTIVVATGVTGLTLVVSGASITSTVASPIDLQGTANVTLQLKDGTTNTLDASGANGKAGIGTNGTATLNITGTGSLNATGGSNGAGIGGGNAQAGGTISISGGAVTATGGVGGAGIGGGNGGVGGGGVISINGGTVNATGGNNGAGIGGGLNYPGGTITISGGTVTAVGGSIYGAGIGGGINGAGGNITIDGGIVTATGGSLGGAGIGACNNYSGGNITIGGGNITALSKSIDPGIGGGVGGVGGGTITINGGTVIARGGIGGVDGTNAVNNISIDASAIVMAASLARPAIYGTVGSSGSAINAILSSVISTSAAIYLKCGDNILTLPANYTGFGFSATSPSSVAAYSDQACTTKLYNIVTTGGAIAIPVSAIKNYIPVNISPVLTGTITLAINPFNGQTTATAIGGNTSSSGTLTYTWTGGATGTGQTATPALGEEATCTVTASGKMGSIQAKTTVYQVTVTPSGNTGTDSASITNAYGKVGDNVSIAYTLDGTGTLSNTLTYSGAASNPAAVSTAVGTTVSGISTYTIPSSGITSGAIALTATFAHTNVPTPPDPVDPGTSHHSDTTPPINGAAGSLGTPVTTASEGRTITTVKIDEQMLEQLLAAEGDKPVVIIPLTTNSDVQICEFNGQMLSDMDNKQAVLEIKTDLATYTLPAQEINLAAVLEELGTGVALEDIKVTIEIGKASDSVALIVENAAKEGEFSIVAPPVEFNLRCTYGDRTVDVKKFVDFVERTVAIPDGVDPSKITTGIVIGADGTVSHVPTEIIVIDGKYFAKINSLTNSVYSVVWNPIEFSDVKNHWAKEAVNDMGSRMVISGVGKGIFEPDRKTTRAEFAAIIIRSLGLKAGNGNNKFIDVKSTDWYLPYIETASEYGIISGYDNKRFGPMDQITREQAMTMVARAMKITGLKVEFSANEAEKLLAAFDDGQKSSIWSKESMAECIKAGIVAGKSETKLAPADQISRAEVAVIVRRLLQKSNLI